PQTDLITAMWAAFGIVNALYRRERTGEGEYMDLGMLDATLPWMTKQAGKVFAGESPGRMGSRDPVLAPYQSYETADGYLNVACGNQRLWEGFCAAIDREDLLEDPRFETNADRVTNMDELEAEVESRLETAETEEWTEILHEAGIPAGPVQSVEEALSNEQTEARGTVGTIDDPERGEIPVIEHPLNFERAESGFESPPPKLGEHSREVFEAIGYSESDIEDLERRGAFGSESA
ncbi:MAG: CaiB/BaiF CoA transferase family protein, partial [Natronomonas sp.]